jgi:DNA topoisomerase IB
VRLRRSTVGGPGFRRIRRGRGFCYVSNVGARGDSVDDPETLERIEALVIPPAWKDVWICPHPNGHIQAVGTDAAGRRGEEFTVKDLRTWHGTVLAAEGFAIAREPTSKTTRRREEAAVMRAVAEELGNTPTVARGSYVDPRVVRAYEQGITIGPALHRAQRQRTPEARRETIERATALIIKRVDRA